MDDVNPAVRTRGWSRAWRAAGLAVGAILIAGALIAVVSRASSLGHTVGSTISNDWVSITLVSFGVVDDTSDTQATADQRSEDAHVRY